AGFGRIASIITVLLSIQVFDRVGHGWLFAIFAAAFAIGAIAALLLPEMRDKPLQTDLAS
ncbi:MAG: MFS transporter, partial [Micrococcales bacterium]|nr:MFS transporter [Micrococcales bacterium]